MENAAFFTVTSLIRVVIWGVLTVNISRHRLHRCYPLATLYIAFAAVAFLVRVLSASAIGTGVLYGHIYLWSAIPAHALAFALLLQCYALPKGLGKRDLHLILAIPLIIAIEASAPWNSHIIYRSLNAIYLYQSYLALSTIVKLFTNRITIGRNLGAIIAALLFPATARSSINALSLYDPNIWTYGFTNIGLELVDLASWAILAFGLRVPHTPIERIEKTEPQQARKQMAGLIRTLWRKA